MASIEIKKLATELLEDWLSYFDNGAFSDDDEWPGCYCMHFHWNEGLDKRNDWNETLEQVYRKTGKADNRSRAIRLIKKGTMQGYLAYCEGKVVGWCNANDKKNYNTVLNSFFYNTKINRKIKSIVCFCIRPNMRRMGIATRLLDKIVLDAKEEGYDCIEVYPYSHRHDNDFHGSLAMYEKMGFTRIGKNMDGCIVMQMNIL